MEPEDEVDRKYYLSEEAVSKMVIATEKAEESSMKVKRLGHSNNFRRYNQVFDTTGITESIDTSGGGGHQPCTIVRSVLTPDRAEKRQNGRRMKEDGEPSFTLTGQDIHGVAIQAKSILFPGRAEHGQPRRRVKEDGEPTFALTAQVVHGVAVWDIRDRKGNYKRDQQNASTISVGGHGSGNHSDMDVLTKFTPLQPDQIGRTVRKGGRDSMSDKHNWNIVQSGQWQIRRLTPTECERLQGFPDGWTEGVSDTQRYKTLGNAVTSTVVSAVMKKLFRKEV